MVPWKLILFLILMTIFVIFAGLNIKNVSDISVGFTTIEGVPIFLSLFIAFLAGAFFMLPFAFRSNKKSKNSISKTTKKKTPAVQESLQTGNSLNLQNDIIEDEYPTDIKKDEKR